MRSRSLACLLALVPAVAFGQTPGEPTIRFIGPTVIVTAPLKQPVEIQKVPASVTAVPGETLYQAGISMVSDAAIYAPNVFFSEFTARKLSVARFRGIGGSPANPAVTTYIDGVPQLNSNSSSTEFLDSEQVEFVRGTQSALFGRNTLGGLVNVTSARPSLSKWTGRVQAPFGNFTEAGVRASASGPIAENLAVGLAVGRSQRDGYTVNDVTGHDLDSREATFGKAQLLWTPSSQWEVRFVANGERARDGDYALMDLGSLRSNPFHASRDFEGFTDRDIASGTLQLRREGMNTVLTSTTGLLWWKTHDLTDLDYTTFPAVTRDNREDDTQFSQEIRLASAVNAPISLGSGTALSWQVGGALFSQRYSQDAVNTFAPFFPPFSQAFPIDNHSPRASLDDLGISAYGQGTVTFADRFDVALGLRVDHENKDADLNSFFAPAVAPPTTVVRTRSFSDVSPQASIAYRPRENHMVYGSVGRGFRAGGFNPTSPSNAVEYNEEHAWHIEGGAKTAWLDGKFVANASVFDIEWQDLQVNLPDPGSPGAFYIANAGGARSAGFELELDAQPHPHMGLFSSFGYTHARFKSGSVSGTPTGVQVNVTDNKLPSTPDYTAMVGAQVTHPVTSSLALFGRGEAVFNGGFQYDDANTASQEAYALANFRLGVQHKRVVFEGWIRNAFDTHYIPLAFGFTGAASGFLGESGRPRTFGVSAGVTF